jgi:hypothetical protein
VHVLMEADADPRAGEPNAIASTKMFSRSDLLSVLGARELRCSDSPSSATPPQCSLNTITPRPSDSQLEVSHFSLG